MCGLATAAVCTKFLKVMINPRDFEKGIFQVSPKDGYCDK